MKSIFKYMTNKQIASTNSIGILPDDDKATF